jgi:hypothetical protein
MASVNETSNEKLDHLLLGQGALKALRPFFSDQESALDYYAKRMTALFLPDRAANECECCQRRSGDLQVVFTWQAIYHTRTTLAVGIVGIVMAMFARHLFHSLFKQIAFSTTHFLCGDCYQQVQRKKIFMAFAKQFFLVLIVISAVIFTSVIVYAFVFLIPQPAENDFIYIVAGIFGGVIFLAGGLFGADQVAQWRVPKPMRFLAKPPFQLVAWNKRSS